MTEIKTWQKRIKECHPSSDPQYWPDELIAKYARLECDELRAELARLEAARSVEPPMTEIKKWDERWKPDGRTSPKRVMVEEIHDLRTENARLEAALKERGEPMTAVADRYAHRLALELECVLADRNVNWDRAMNLIGEYRSAMNAIHEQHSPTHMGEPVLEATK